jgi:hypothetical protein
MHLVVTIFLIVSGLVLIGAAGERVPLIGKFLAKAGAWLSTFAIIIGIVDLVLGIIYIFD